MGISVLMSVYKKEKPHYLRKALESILSQTLCCDELVLIKDGPLGAELEDVIKDFSMKNPKIKPYALKENVQLGRALAIGVRLCKNELIARMDTDDIAVPERLQIQSEYMNRHPDVAVLGGNIAEFMKEGEILRVKEMPSEYHKLYCYGKIRNPLNHMTVMFRKQAVLDCGNYVHFPLLEDYHLWSRMLAKGYVIQNIPEILVYARIDAGFAEKRGGFIYFQRYKKLRRLQYEMGYTNVWEYLRGLICSFGMTMQPLWMRNVVYRCLLRR